MDWIISEILIYDLIKYNFFLIKWKYYTNYLDELFDRYFEILLFAAMTYDDNIIEFFHLYDGYYITSIYDFKVNYLLPAYNYSTKLSISLLFLIFIRAGLPRYRYDYITKLGWLKFLFLILFFFLIFYIIYILY